MSESFAFASRARLPASAKPLTVYLKPSDRCTVGCAHCYLPESVRADKTCMTDAIFESAIDAIETMAHRQKAIGVLIVWHGGEPLSLDPTYFAKLADRAAERLPKAVQSLQTSLIPYGTKWRGLVEKHFGGEIGTSVDFTQRTLKGSNARYLALWMDKVHMARAHGFRVIPGMVPSKGEMGRAAEIVDWLHQNGFKSWNIDRYNQFGGHDPMRPTNAEHSTFLRDVFDAIMEQAKNGHHVGVNVVRAALGGVLYNSPGERWGGTCSHDFLVVNPDGRTNACPDMVSFRGFSNIADGYDAFRESEARKSWIRKHIVGHRNPDCPTCPFNSFCKSGCPLTPNTPETEGECSGYHRYLHHVRAFARREPNLVSTYLEATR